MKRFNKNNVLDHIESQLQAYEKRWGFDRNNGYSQVQNAEFEKVLAYGEYEAYQSMADSINWQSL